MPDWRSLQVDDRIRLLRVPEDDLRQRDRERADNRPGAGYTADIIELIIARTPVVRIDFIDEDGRPWYEATVEVDGNIEYHSLALMDEASWEHA